MVMFRIMQNFLLSGVLLAKDLIPVTEKRKTSLNQEDLEAARQRALSAGPLPDAVRRELVNIWNRQSNLPKEQRSLLHSRLQPNGWVIVQLVPLLCRFFSRTLRQKDGDAGLHVAEVLDEVAELVLSNVPEAVQRLVQAWPEGKGSRFAGQCQVRVLRILDLGIVGLPFMAFAYAEAIGKTEISSALISEGINSILESIEEGINEQHNEGEWSWNYSLWIPSEFLSPDDFNSFPVKGISPR